MLLLAILLGTLGAGIGSVWIAAFLSFGILNKYTQHMLSLAAGALLATAFMHLLPEAFESGLDPQHLFVTLLGGVIFFFLLDKAELWHHGHEHSHVDVHEQKGHDHHQATQPGSWALITGDSVHCFGDGILIASAFMADIRLGVIASIAVLAHEVPHHMGDLVVLRGGASSKKTAFIKVSMAGAVTAIGGLLGLWLLEGLKDYLPYVLVLAASSFMYVALADLIPQLQKRVSAKETTAQITWLMLGIGLVYIVSVIAHKH